jgi:phosphomannomutase
MGIFKAYDIRGIYPEEIDEEKARRIGNAFAMFLQAEPIVVGRDMRLSSPSIAAATIEGIRDAGRKVVDIGMCSTPMSYFAVGHWEYAGGLMVTASHNPAQYNGFKVCREKAIPVGSASGLAEVQQRLDRGDYHEAERRGEVEERDIFPAFRDHLRNFMREIAPLKIAVDTGNGMVGKFLPDVLSGLTLEVVPLYFEPDGRFPNHEANPLKPENLRDLMAAMKREGAVLGMAFDGDGDRCSFIDEKGEIVSNDMVTALIAEEMLRENPGAAIVYDLRSSWALREEIERCGGVPIEERVGHAFIKATMRKHDAVFGGELSGHYYFKSNYYADSALIAMIEILNLLSREGKTLSELVAPLRRYHATGEVNFEVADKDAVLARLEEVFSDGKVGHLDGVTVQYADWWFNVRKSNTEPVLRLNLEAKTPERLEEAKERLLAILGTPMGSK